jgi:hypothetical protein
LKLDTMKEILLMLVDLEMALLVHYFN